MSPVRVYVTPANDNRELAPTAESEAYLRWNPVKLKPYEVVECYLDSDAVHVTRGFGWETERYYA